MYARSERLKELFQQEVSKILAELKDPGISGLVTVTGVELSADMKNGKVFYSVLGVEKDRESTAKALERAADFVRGLLLKKLSLRRVPHLVFVFDGTAEKADRIEHLLAKIQSDEGAAPPPEHGDLGPLASRPPLPRPRTRRRRR
ncbi:MAG: 30S ribosome-binding factor RbfA [Elusimicrobiota bacterium]|jgi:ribosome-binding factor A